MEIEGGIKINDYATIGIGIISLAALVVSMLSYRRSGKQDERSYYETLLSNFISIRNSVSVEFNSTQHERKKDAQGRPTGQQERKEKCVRMGIAAFNFIAMRVSRDTKESRNWIDSDGQPCLDDRYYREYAAMEQSFNHYFIFLYDLISQVTTDKSLKKRERRKYMERLRGALSSGESVVLYYYCIGETDLSCNLKQYAIEHNLFKVLPTHFADSRSDNYNKFYSQETNQSNTR
ncbi:MAG: hypothetical protein F4Y79_13015 [Gemmatimonadetes bacterium]|nr:hypothetical protein [Gemmatimonadota bacterium]